MPCLFFDSHLYPSIEVPKLNIDSPGVQEKYTFLILVWSLSVLLFLLDGAVVKAP